MYTGSFLLSDDKMKYTGRVGFDVDPGVRGGTLENEWGFSWERFFRNDLVSRSGVSKVKIKKITFIIFSELDELFEWNLVRVVFSWTAVTCGSAKSRNQPVADVGYGFNK